MESLYNVDPVQARTYVTNNRHNHTTALYYLLEIKLSREGKLGGTDGAYGIKPKAVEDNFVKQENLSESKNSGKSPGKKEEKEKEKE